MIENILFGKIVLPGELVRVTFAIIGTAVAAYYDVFNKKNVPDLLLYAFLGVAFLTNLVLFDPDLLWFSLIFAVFFSAVGYVFYRLGQLGGADVFVIASIALLVPIHPSFVGLPFNFPFIFSVMIFSGVLFALYVLISFGWRLMRIEAKPNYVYLLMFIPYAIFAYVYVNSFLFSPIYFVFITILLFASIFFLTFRESLLSLLAEELPVSQLEPEDVCAVELMNKDLVKRYNIPRLLKASDITKLQNSKVADIWVYTRLPPFLPFLLAGMLLALFFSKGLILI